MRHAARPHAHMPDSTTTRAQAARRNNDACLLKFVSQDSVADAERWVQAAQRLPPLTARQMFAHTQTGSARLGAWLLPMHNVRSPAMLQLFAGAGVSVNQRDPEHGATPVMSAAKRGRLAIVRAFLAFEELNVDAQDDDGNTLLHVICGWEAQVMFFQNSLGELSEGAAMQAFEAERAAIFRAILPRTNTRLVNRRHEHVLHAAVQGLASRSIVKEILADSPNLLFRADRFGQLPVHFATDVCCWPVSPYAQCSGRRLTRIIGGLGSHFTATVEAMSAAFAKARADPGPGTRTPDFDAKWPVVTDRWGRTPLLYACENMFAPAALCEALIAAGDDPAATAEDAGAMHFLARAQHRGLLLPRAHAAGCAELHAALVAGFAERFAVLLRHAPGLAGDFTCAGRARFSLQPLLCAVHENNVPFVDALRRAGIKAPIGARDAAGYTALHLCRSVEMLDALVAHATWRCRGPARARETLRRLLRCRAWNDAAADCPEAQRGGSGATVLHSVCANLPQHPLYAVAHYGCTAEARRYNVAGMLRRLCALGASVDETCARFGRTALHACVQTLFNRALTRAHRHNLLHAALQLVLEHGADCTVPNADGEGALLCLVRGPVRRTYLPDAFFAAGVRLVGPTRRAFRFHCVACEGLCSAGLVYRLCTALLRRGGLFEAPAAAARKRKRQQPQAPAPRAALDVSVELTCGGPRTTRTLADAAHELLGPRPARPVDCASGGVFRAAGDALLCPLRLAFYDEACERRLACAMMLDAALAAAPAAPAVELIERLELGVFRKIVDKATRDWMQFGF